MYGKHFIVAMMLGIAFCLGATVEAAKKPAAANTEAADQTQPKVSATPAEKPAAANTEATDQTQPKVSATPAEKPAAANTEAADQTQPKVSATPAESPKAPPSTVPAAQTKKADDAAPKAFLPQKRFTFPSAMDGAKVLHDFIVQNKGDAPLKITKVKTG